jgi:GAF domain-containing protein/sugar diacid utilization regulator
MAVQNASAQELNTRVRELTFLQHIAKLASSTRDYDEMLKGIIDETTVAMATQVCSLYLLEEGQDSLVLTATNGLAQAGVGRVHLRLGEGVTGSVAQAQRPLVVNDVASEPRFKFVPGLDTERFASMLSVPVLAGNRVVGVMNVETLRAHQFTPEEVEFLSAIAGQVAGIVEKATLQRRLEAKLREATALYEASTILGSTLELDQLLQLLLQLLARIFPETLSSVLLLDDASQDLVARAALGFSWREIPKRIGRVGEGISGEVVQQGRAAVVADIRAEPRYRLPELAEQEGVVSMLSVPLKGSAAILGVMNIYTKERHVFRPEEMNFANTIANQAALAIEKAKSFEQERATVARLRETTKALRRSEEIHREFTQLVLEERGVEAIARTLGTLLGARVVVEDPLHRAVAAAGAGLGTEGTPGPPMAALSQRTRARPEVAEALARAVRERQSVPLPAVAGTELEASRVLLPILAGEETLGFVSAEIAELPPSALRAMEHAATVLSLQFMKERSAAEVELRLRGDFFDDLVSPHLTREQEQHLVTRAGFLGYDFTRPYAVLVLDIDQFDELIARHALSEPQVVAVKRKLFDLVVQKVEGPHAASVAISRSDSIVLLLALARDGRDPSRVLAEQLQADSARLFSGLTISIGIGQPCERPRDFHVSYTQARRALDMMKHFGKRSQLVSYEGLGAYRVLLQVQDPEGLRRFMDEVLGRLLEYDRKRHGTLVPTLEAFLQNHGNLQATARSLHLHVNSLSYRLERIAAIGGVNLDDSEQRLNIALSLKIRRLLASEGT